MLSLAGTTLWTAAPLVPELYRRDLSRSRSLVARWSLLDVLRFTGPMGDAVTLRPIEEVDLDRLLRLFTEPGLAGEFQWFGFQIQHATELRRRWEADRLCGEESFLAVVLEDGTLRRLGQLAPCGTPRNYEIGIALFPEYRGKGIGTEAAPAGPPPFGRDPRQPDPGRHGVRQLSGAASVGEGRLPLGSSATRFALPRGPLAGQCHVRPHP